jgi:uncharacterized protein YhfF
VSPDPVAEFIAQARLAVPALRLAQWKQRSFGNSAALADILIDLIARGEKTGTFSVPAEFRDRPEAAPLTGDHFLVTRFDGTPTLLYRVTEVETLPFTAIAQRHVDCEGPQLRDVAAWRAVHWEYWTAILGRHGETPHAQMPVIFQRFTVIHPAID